MTESGPPRFVTRVRPSPRACALLPALALAACDDVEATARRSRSAAAEIRATAVAPTRADSLVAAIGCARCHEGLAVPSAEMPAPPLGDAGRRYSTAWLLDYLQRPVRIRAELGAARMPDFGFDEAEALAVAAYLSTLDRMPRSASDSVRVPAPSATRRDSLDRALEQARRRHPRATAGVGQRIVESQGCAVCHDLPGARAWKTGPDLSREGVRVREEWLRSWLRHPAPVRPFGTHPGTGSRMPDFRLTSAEADSVAAHLMRRREATTVSARFAPAPLTPFRRRETARLVERRQSCLGCHAVEGQGGRIAPALDGVADRLEPAFVHRLIVDPQHTVPGTVMPRAPMPLAEVDRVASWVLTLPARDSATARLSLVDVPPRAPERASGGAGDYARLCATCHGPTGNGDGYNARFLPVAPARHADAAAMSLRPDDVLYDGIAAGGLALGKSPRMPAFGQTLSPEQIRGLVRHIRTLCRCEGPAWSRDGAARP